MNNDTEAKSSVVQTSPSSPTDNERHKSCQTLPMSPRSVGVIFLFILFYLLFFFYLLLIQLNY